MTRYLKYLEEAKRAAASSPMARKMGAVMWEDGLVYQGHNYVPWPSRINWPAMRGLPSLHAELDCLQRRVADIWWNGNIRNAHMLVARIRKDNSLGNSRPCEVCWGAIADSGIRTVTYMQDGRWVTWRLW